MCVLGGRDVRGLQVLRRVGAACHATGPGRACCQEGSQRFTAKQLLPAHSPTKLAERLCRT